MILTLQKNLSHWLQKLPLLTRHFSPHNSRHSKVTCYYGCHLKWKFRFNQNRSKFFCFWQGMNCVDFLKSRNPKFSKNYWIGIGKVLEIPKFLIFWSQNIPNNIRPKYSKILKRLILHIVSNEYNLKLITS